MNAYENVSALVLCDDWPAWDSFLSWDAVFDVIMTKLELFSLAFETMAHTQGRLVQELQVVLLLELNLLDLFVLWLHFCFGLIGFCSLIFV